ncbi:MAG: MerR family transcriptional regulator [Clostridia bacterium]|nr:MerR family transcriptional regulator [Clostridia bacterium]
MKIKEVTQLTGLTDKAIRLYIENGLVSPSISEDYSGRRKIDFSQADADRLKNVAVLRKAGFSMNGIKQIISGGEAAESTVKAFIEETKEQISQQSDTVAILENADFEQGITLESLCAVLVNSAVEKPVPKEDMEPSLGERIVRQVFSIIGGIGAILSLIPVGWFMWQWFSYKHLKFDGGMVWWAALTNLWFVVLSVLWLVLYRGNTENRFFRRKNKMKIKSNVALSALFAGATPLAAVWFMFSAWLFGGDIHCETDKPEHYLDFYKEANWIYREAIEIFPSEVPEYAENVKYYYRLDGDYYEVFAEWSIPGYTTSEEDMKELLEEIHGEEYYGLFDEIKEQNFYEVKNMEYEKAKARVIEKTLSLRTDTDFDIDYENGDFSGTELKYEVNKINPVNKGDWVCYFFKGASMLSDWDDHYLVFAYNDKTQTLRYILSKSDDPYPAQLEW